MTEIDKVNDLIIEGLEQQLKITREMIESLKTSNEYLLKKLVKYDIHNEELTEELNTLK